MNEEVHYSQKKKELIQQKMSHGDDEWERRIEVLVCGAKGS